MVQHGRNQGEMRAPSQRQLRVGELIRHALAEILARGELMDDDLAKMMITVPEVRVSPDLRNATVYITPLGGGDHKAAEKAITRHARWLRGQVAKRINLKFAPDLVFPLRRPLRRDGTHRCAAAVAGRRARPRRRGEGRNGRQLTDSVSSGAATS